MIIVEKGKDFNPEFYSKFPIVSESEKKTTFLSKVFLKKILGFIHICEGVFLQSHSTTNLL